MNICKKLLCTVVQISILLQEELYCNTVREVFWFSLSLKCEVSIVVDECYSSGEKVVSMSSCAGFDGPGSSTTEKWLEVEVMSRMKGVSCNFAGCYRCPEALADYLQ